MILPPELEKYIVDARKSGASDDAIKVELARVGWKEEDITAAFAPPSKIDNSISSLPSADFSSPAITSPSITAATPVSQPVVTQRAAISSPVKQHSMKAIVFSIVGVILLTALGVSAYVYLPALLDEPPYGVDTFLTDATENLVGLDSASYVIAISSKGGPRTAIKGQSLKEAFPEYAPKKSTSTSYNYVPYAEREKEPFITEMIRSEETVFGFLPSDFTAEIALHGGVEKPTSGGLKPGGQVGVTASFATADSSYNADLEFIVHDGAIYGKINRMPSLLFFSFDRIKGQWVKLGDTASSSDYLSDTAKGDEGVLILEALRQMPRVADEVGVISVSGEPVRVDLNGETTYRYDLELNAEKIVAFYDRMTPILRELVPTDKLEEFDEATKDQRIKLSDPSFVKYFEHLKSQSTWSVWVSKSSKLPVRVASSGYLVPSAVAVSSSTKTSTLGQLDVTFSVDLSDINVPISVTAPANFIILKEASNLMMSSDY